MPILLMGAHFSSCNPPPMDAGMFMTKQGQPYHWSTSVLPIAVNVDETLPLNMIYNVHKAAQRWNNALGMEVFRVSQVPPENYGVIGFANWGTISVGMTELGMGTRGTILGQAEINLRSGEAGRMGLIHSVNLWLDKDLGPQNLYGVAVHELGHCLGLMHDGDPTSIMFWTPLKGQYIFDEDIHRIREFLL